MKRAEYMQLVSDMECKVNKYDWQDRSVHPYSFPIKITKILIELKSFDECTRDSKEYLISLAIGLKGIIEAWEKHELEPKVRVRIIKTGKIIEISKEMADVMTDLIELI